MLNIRDIYKAYNARQRRNAIPVNCLHEHGFEAGFQEAIAMLYAEVKPEELQDGKWYWIKECHGGLPANYDSANKLFWMGRAVFEVCGIDSIRGPILTPSELLQAAEEVE